MTRESLYLDRGELSWHVLIRAPEIRDLPLVSPVAPPRFHYGSGDGTKPADQSVSYVSADPGAVGAAVEHARGLGWAARPSSERDVLELVRDTRVLRIEANPAAGGVRIDVGLWE
ncbi:MAG: hypothetical protein H0V89_08595 [Deltaproteobacteria bacterium]|nr:hypothetical protein [Deltaproteobacteria bacterium]